ncbi:MAG: 23S rRNA (uracil(1939)-C(5))-methyltransferase RlmD [Oscillospiraceae bacterium]|nr:23S rRNA (uracil(1939)-C(5))-methyltransferase RlmD [Oscillospiraceae bacterium]
MDNGRTCSYRRKCGACQTLNLSYDEELSLKMKREIDLLGRFGHIEPIIPSEPSEHYRNKAQYLFRYRSGSVTAGLYRSSDGGIAAVDSCLMEDPRLTELFLLIKKLVKKRGVKVWDGRRGDLRHVMIRRAAATGEVSVAFVTSGGLFEGASGLSEELTEKAPDVVCVSAVRNDTDIPLWMNGDEHLLKGRGYITDRLCGCEFRIPPKSFYQINPYATEKLYDIAAGYAQIGRNDTVLDAYCGIGTVGITAAKGGCASLDGFDISADSVSAAETNAELNGIDGCRYRRVSDSGCGIGPKKRYSVVMVDPPRSGCDRRFTNTLLKLRPERIVYISCGPQSLARDLGLLKKHYRVDKIQPVDMFPGTIHVETVCCLYHQKKDFISIPYEPKNADYLKKIK